MKILNETDRVLTLRSEKETPAFLNAMRRCIISELPSMAITEVDFYENNSALFNDYLANRIGLIPLTWEEGIEDDAKISLSLNAEAIDEIKTVYSKDLVSADSKIKVFEENIPIMVLNKNQRLRLEAFAQKGTSKEHARFENAMASFGHSSEFKAVSKCKKCSTSLKAFAPLEGKKDLHDNSFLCGNCEKQEERSKDFVFVVESFNNLSAKQQYDRALKVMQSQAKALEKQF